MIVLDSTALIDLFNNDGDLRVLIERTDDEIATTMMNVQEIYAGLCDRVKNRNKEMLFFNRLFDKLHVLPMSKHTVEDALKIHKTLAAKGITIGFADCIIVATLREHDLRLLVTRNVKHFEHVENLVLVTY